MATKKTNYTYAVGKRKEAIARVRLYKGEGDSTVNGMMFNKYFPGKVSEELFNKPFKVADCVDKFHVTVRVVGGGKNGQLEATMAGISKVLSDINKKDYRKPLKDAGLLTRDSRIRERRKVGTGGKARRAKQSPKR